MPKETRLEFFWPWKTQLINVFAYGICVLYSFLCSYNECNVTINLSKGQDVKNNQYSSVINNYIISLQKFSKFKLFNVFVSGIIFVCVWYNFTWIVKVHITWFSARMYISCSKWFIYIYFLSNSCLYKLSWNHNITILHYTSESLPAVNSDEKTQQTSLVCI